MTAASVLRARADEWERYRSLAGEKSDFDEAFAAIYKRHAAELRALADLVEAERAFAARAPDGSFAEYQWLTTALKLAGDNVERVVKEQGNE